MNPYLVHSVYEERELRKVLEYIIIIKRKKQQTIYCRKTAKVLRIRWNTQYYKILNSPTHTKYLSKYYGSINQQHSVIDLGEIRNMRYTLHGKFR